jgi:hypothetical protein
LRVAGRKNAKRIIGRSNFAAVAGNLAHRRAKILTPITARGLKGAVKMIHYSCDLCKRDFDPDDDLRYVVKIEVYAAYDSNSSAADDEDHDHLQEIQDILENMEDAEDERIGDDVYQQLRFDLCPECRRKFLKNPLAREKPAKAFGFSSN